MVQSIRCGARRRIFSPVIRYVVPEQEIEFRASRAGGPGGQHVNKASTRIEVLWDVVRSPSLDDDRRARILTALASRIDAAGVLRVVAAERRSQLRNRQAALERLQSLVDRALHRPPTRKPTRPPRAAKEQRFKLKRHRGEAKHLRRRVRDEED
jgi:ribosome-associated protein